jgi:hypothetical protein
VKQYEPNIAFGLIPNMVLVSSVIEVNEKKLLKAAKSVEIE